MPSPNCIANVVSRLSPKGSQACLLSWTRKAAQVTDGEVIAVDGKTARGSRDRKRGRGPLHMVSAWASANRSSIPADAPRFAHAVRGHRGVENRLHWRLDVVFGEDTSRIRKGHAPTIMTSLRHRCMNPFEQEPSPLSLAKKRRKAAWNDDYRAEVVFA